VACFEEETMVRFAGVLVVLCAVGCVQGPSDLDFGAPNPSSSSSGSGSSSQTGESSSSAPSGPTTDPTTKPSAAPSCAREHGGHTCGADGNEDCCTTAKQGTFTIDKYLVTAGRMRTFIEKTNGNIRGFVGGLPADKWKPSWTTDETIPSDVESANRLLGAFGKKACGQGAHTGHTYWTPKTAEDYSDFDQTTLDEKALNCVPWAMLQALCVSDGGHLATLEELKAAFTNDGTTKYPWGDDDLPSTSRPDPENRLNMEAGFETATAPINPDFRKDGNGKPTEVSFLISPPGRFPKGNNKVGIADAAGNLLEWVGDAERQFVWKADFEHHASNAATFNFGYFWWEARKNIPLGLGAGRWTWGDGQLYGNAGLPNEKHGYYSIGGRCAR